MTPFTIIAHLENGFIAGDPWSPAIDGILGYAYHLERMDFETFTAKSAMTSELEPADDLPLLKVEHNGLWWYACSSPIADKKVGVIGQEKKFYHSRFDDYAASKYVPDVKKVLTSAGPYKGSRNYELRIMTPSIHWNCIGDMSECQRLLGLLKEPQVGAGRARGYGVVKRWEFIAGDDNTTTSARTHRPLPSDYAALNGVLGPEVLTGFRPPARAPVNRTLCVMPTRLVA